MAGGAGTRGRPYTDYIPKAMIPLRGTPIVEIIARHLAASRAVESITIVADMRGQGRLIRGHLERMRLGVPLSFAHGARGGTAGDVLCARSELAGCGRFVLWFADNLCALDVAAMAAHHEAAAREACVAVRTRRREETGFAAVRGGLVSEFCEKPVLELPMAECLGVYVLSESVLRRIRRARRERGRADLSYDVLEPLAAAGGLSAYDIGRAGWLDVESPAVLERRAREARRIASAMLGARGRAAPQRRRSFRRARA